MSKHHIPLSQELIDEITFIVDSILKEEFVLSMDFAHHCLLPDCVSGILTKDSPIKND